MTRSTGGHASRGGRPRSRVIAQIRREEGHCHLCGYPIDLAYPRGHKLSSTADEIIPVEDGGSTIDRTNIRHAHLSCNSYRGIQPVTEALRHACRTRMAQMLAEGLQRPVTTYRHRW